MLCRNVKKAKRQEEGGSMRLLNLTLTAALGASLLVGCGGGSSDAALDDIQVTKCEPDSAGAKPKAEGTIRNNTTKPSGYTFRVRFLDPSGNEVSQGASVVGRVEPGATVGWRLEGGTSAKGALTCQVENAARTAVG